MRYLLFLCPSICLAAWITPDGEIFDNLPRKYGNTGNISASWAIENGWQEISATQAAELRCVKGGGTWVDGVCVMPPEPEPQPVQPTSYPQGIEVPYVVYLDATNRQIGIAHEMIEVESNVYAEIVYKFHASPIVWEQVESNRNAAIGSKKAEHAARKAIATDAKATKENASANRNKPATQADIERLAEMIEKMMENQ